MKKRLSIDRFTSMRENTRSIEWIFAVSDYVCCMNVYMSIYSMCSMQTSCACLFGV